MRHNQKCRTSFFGFCLSLSLVYLVGCGGKPATVSGIVTIDGKPLQQGTVAFSPASGGMRATGAIRTDGSYKIRTNRESGLDIGDYEVSVVSREIVISEPGLPPMPGKYIAPKRYGRPKTSGLRFNVEKGKNTIDIELESEAEDTARKTRRGR